MLHSSVPPTSRRPAEVLDVAVMQRVEGAVHHRHFLPVLLQIPVSDDHASQAGDRTRLENPAPTGLRPRLRAPLSRTAEKFIAAG